MTTTQSPSSNQANTATQAPMPTSSRGENSKLRHSHIPASMLCSLSSPSPGSGFCVLPGSLQKGAAAAAARQAAEMRHKRMNALGAATGCSVQLQPRTFHTPSRGDKASCALLLALGGKLANTKQAHAKMSEGQGHILQCNSPALLPAMSLMLLLLLRCCTAACKHN